MEFHENKRNLYIQWDKSQRHNLLQMNGMNEILTYTNNKTNYEMKKKNIKLNTHL